MKLAHPILAAASVLLALPAQAACPVELATYRDRDGRAEINFTPAGEGAVVTNRFRLIVADAVFDGLVMWSGGEARSFGQLGYKCPDGDVTGAEIEACTAWEGPLYAVDEAGGVGLLPAEGAPAPATLLLAGLGPYLGGSPAAETAGLTEFPFDSFHLSGCQE